MPERTLALYLFFFYALISALDIYNADISDTMSTVKRKLKAGVDKKEEEVEKKNIDKIADSEDEALGKDLELDKYVIF